jgi:hypothetical protein
MNSRMTFLSHKTRILLTRFSSQSLAQKISGLVLKNERSTESQKFPTQSENVPQVLNSKLYLVSRKNILFKTHI